MQRAQKSESAAVDDSRAPEVVDPVCGMRIAPEDAVGSHVHGGTTYHFCSKKCLEDFRANPTQFTRPSHVHTVTSSTSGSREDAEYTCPMHPEVRQTGPGNCPKCGMALEPVTPAPPAARTEYICPMHPEIVRNEPGSCPICGMALEPRVVTREETASPELTDMTCRFWVGLALALPVVVLEMGGHLPGLHRLIPPQLSGWMQLVLATPVVLWAGWPFFVRGWFSVVARSLNMFTLVAMGTGVA
jgi:P-type Cu+ transporter